MFRLLLQEAENRSGDQHQPPPSSQVSNRPRPGQRPPQAQPRLDEERRNQHQSPVADDNSHRKKIFVAGFTAGNITDCFIGRTSDGKLKDFGFVTFDNYNDVTDVLGKKNHDINGHVVKVEKARPKIQRPDSATNLASGRGNHRRHRGNRRRNNNRPPVNDDDEEEQNSDHSDHNFDN
ncbi:unnamed protein product, partial [Rotaria sordida]